MLFQGALANFNPHAATTSTSATRNGRPSCSSPAGRTTSSRRRRTPSAKHYRKSSAITEYKEFPGRSHYIIGQDGWEEVADYALDWALRAADAYAGSPAPA